MLMLRKDCQPLLDAIGMVDAHVEVDKYNKSPKIVGSCGKSIVDLSGIVFSKNTINASERAYGVELIGKFLEDNKDKFEELLKLSESLETYRKMSIPTGTYKINYGEAIEILDDVSGDKSGIVVTLENINVNLTTLGHYANDISRLIERYADKILEIKEYLENKKRENKVQDEICNLKSAIYKCSI